MILTSLTPPLSSTARSQYVSMASLLLCAQSLPTLVSIILLAATKPSLAPLVSGLACLLAGLGLAIQTLLAANKKKARKC